LSAEAHPRVGLALSGGFAKVIAHIGILRALTEAKIPIHAVAGTSGGSIIGAFFAAGWPPDRMEQIARDISWRKLTRVTLPRLGLLSNEKLERFVTDRLGHARFEDLQIPFAVVGADLTTGRKAVFTSGPIGPPIRASCSIPQLFTPVEIDGSLIADGGLAEYLPVESLGALGCDVKIGVNLGGIRNWHVKDPRNFVEVGLRVIGFVSQRNARISEELADCVIRPNLAEFGPYDLHRSDEMIRIGYEYGRRAVPEIQQVIAERSVSRPEEGRIVRWLREHSPFQTLMKRSS